MVPAYPTTSPSLCLDLSTASQKCTCVSWDGMGLCRLNTTTMMALLQSRKVSCATQYSLRPEKSHMENWPPPAMVATSTQKPHVRLWSMWVWSEGGRRRKRPRSVRCLRESTSSVFPTPEAPHTSSLTLLRGSWPRASWLM